MAIQKSIVKMPLGMQTLDFWPIKAEPASSHPTYNESINLGAAVKGYLSITTASASIPGDDITQVEDEVFVKYNPQLSHPCTKNVEIMRFDSTYKIKYLISL